MSKRRGTKQRPSLPRNRKSIRLDLRPTTYAKLVSLVGVDLEGRPEAIVTVVERLIEQASELPTPVK